MLTQAVRKAGTSWKTTATGFLAILAAATDALIAHFDSDPTTVPDWGVVVAAVIAGIGLIAARDNDVTSEEAHGLKPPKKIEDAE